MIKNLENKIKKNIRIFGLILLTLVTAISTTYFNYKKKIDHARYNSFIDNVYFKKTLKTVIKNLEPKYKRIKHKIQSGETFDKVLNNYYVDKKEILTGTIDSMSRDEVEKKLQELKEQYSIETSFEEIKELENKS